MRFPGGGGLLLVATLDPASQPGRSDTVQIWLTKQKAWLIRTEGENVQTERLPYPKPHTVSTMRYLLQFEAPDYQSSVIYQVRKEVVRDIAADGETNAAVPTNGKLRGTTSGIVYLLPDEN